MLKIQNVGAFPGGDAFLLDDGNGACLLDTGFGFCGEALAVHVRRALAERPLDAILLTHSHYDTPAARRTCRRSIPTRRFSRTNTPRRSFKSRAQSA